MAGTKLIGIDVGTTAVKAAVFGPDGTVLDRLHQPHDTQRPESACVEQDARDWTRAIDAALARFTPLMPGVGGIGLTSQVNTHVFVDAEGTPLAPAIVWQDGRAAAEAAELDAQISEAQRLEWWGAPMPIDASHALARMLWMQRHHPEIWDKTRYVLLPKDLCLWHMTGAVVSDPLSNIGLVDLAHRHIPEVLGLVAGAADRMAPLKPLSALAGRVRQGPAQDIPVANGTMDGWVGLLGCGGHREGAASYLSGTSEILGITSEAVHPTPGVIVFAESDGLRMHAGPTQAGGAAQMWWADLNGISPEQMSQRAAASPPDKPAPLFLPHLQGERAPLWNANARGAFLGIDQTSDAADLARSVYEGVAFSVRLLLNALERSAQVQSTELICGGGGFRSDVWNQIRANVLGRTLHRLAVTDPGLLGAAAIARAATGQAPDLASALDELMHIDKTYRPDPALAPLYDAQFAIFEDLTTRLAPVNDRLTALPRPRL
ncbi:xylulokinase [Primorskyibacter sp. S187A]|uniref:xylulokinase n=1 Tax=Primorskyibacter sp. S187A TaxID=3415130 RepID=UPI003C7D42CA